MLQEHGASSKSKAAMIVGKRYTQIPNSQFIYIVQNPLDSSWVKIGKTTQEPIQRLKQYDQGPFQRNMPHIRRTSNCNDAEKDILKNIRALNPIQRANEWFQIPLELAKNAVNAVVDNAYPHPNTQPIHPIIRT